MVQKKRSDCVQNRRRFLRVLGAGSGAAFLLPGAGAPENKGDFPSLAERRAAHEKQGIISPEKTYRTMEWEFHTPPQESFNIDWEAAVKAARKLRAFGFAFDRPGPGSHEIWRHAINGGLRYAC
jgi:hypothetical protein